MAWSWVRYDGRKESIGGLKINADFQSKCLNVERIIDKYRTIHVKLVIEKTTLLS
jgi:hypothetical protein